MGVNLTPLQDGVTKAGVNIDTLVAFVNKLKADCSNDPTMQTKVDAILAAVVVGDNKVIAASQPA